MVELKFKTSAHPAETELAGYLDGSLRAKDRRRVEEHLAHCDECLNKTVSAYESVKQFNPPSHSKRHGANASAGFRRSEKKDSADAN